MRMTNFIRYEGLSALCVSFRQSCLTFGCYYKFCRFRSPCGLRCRFAVGSNPIEGMDFRLLCLLCGLRLLRRTDRSVRGVLPVMCLCMYLLFCDPQKQRDLGPIWAVVPRKRMRCFNWKPSLHVLNLDSAIFI